jgi:glucose-1-phosphate adenylyltransferase
VLTDTYIEAGAVVERCILDKIVVIGHNARVGKIQEMGELGITCVGKNTHVPAGYTVGNNCVLGTDLRLEDFAAYTGKSVPNGTKVGYKAK